MAQPRSGGPTAAIAGKRAVTEAIRAGIVSEVLILQGAHETQGLREVLAAARKAELPVRSVDRDSLDDPADDRRSAVAMAKMPEPLSEPELDSFSFADEAIVVVLGGVGDLP